MLHIAQDPTNRPACSGWKFASGHRSLRALQVIIVTCFAFTLIICFYAAVLFWLKDSHPHPPALPFRTLGYCFIGTSCRFSLLIPSSWLMAYLIQGLHSCFIFIIISSLAAEHWRGKKTPDLNNNQIHGLSWFFATIPLHSLPFSPTPLCLPTGIRGWALSVLSVYTAISKKGLLFLGGTRWVLKGYGCTGWGGEGTWDCFGLCFFPFWFIH